MLGDKRQFSALDPEGKWFEPQLAAVAEKFYRQQMPGPGPRVPSAKILGARAYRENWARQQGCESFAQVLAIGIQNVGRRSASAGQAMGAWTHPAREIPAPLYAPQLEATPPDPLGEDYEASAALQQAEAR